MARFGFIQKFEPEFESIITYLELLEMFLSSDDVEKDKQVPVLLSVVGMKTYSLLCSLLKLKAPKEEKFAHLERVLKVDLEPQRLVIAERFHVYQQCQAAAELCSNYVAELQ